MANIKTITISGETYNIYDANAPHLVNGKILAENLPSYVDDVLEYTNLASFPTTGETGKIYVDKATNLTYRWSGTGYIEISPSTVYSNATQSAAGLMSAEDKTKLDGITSGAQANSITGVKGNAESSYRTGNVNLTASNIGALALSGGTLTGALITNSDIRQTAGYIRGADETATNYAIKLGHNNDNVLNFYEYGGVFNFYKSQSGTDTLLTKIDGSSIKIYNSDGNYRVELRTDNEGGNIRIYNADGSYFYEIDANSTSSIRLYANHSGTNVEVNGTTWDPLTYTPDSGTLHATVFTGAWNGSTIAVNKGGTGNTSFTASKLVYAESASKISSYTSTVGSTAQPIYIKDGVPTAVAHDVATFNSSTQQWCLQFRGTIGGTGSTYHDCTSTGLIMYDRGLAGYAWGGTTNGTMWSWVKDSNGRWVADRATALNTARTLTIGNTGKTFDGSGNVSWSLSEIGAAAASHSHSYLPLSGGVLTGSLNTTVNGGGIYIKNSSGTQHIALYSSTTEGGNIRITSPGGVHTYEWDAVSNTETRIVHGTTDNSITAHQIIALTNEGYLHPSKPIEVGYGGTGATSAINACTNLGSTHHIVWGSSESIATLYTNLKTKIPTSRMSTITLNNTTNISTLSGGAVSSAACYGFVYKNSDTEYFFVVFARNISNPAAVFFHVIFDTNGTPNTTGKHKFNLTTL